MINMKKPYFNSEQRLMIKYNTYHGSGLLLDLSMQKFKRELYNTYPCIVAKIMIFFFNSIKLN